MIPRIFHQIWLGPNPLPDALAGWVESWKRHHPDWEHRLWTEDTLLDGLRPEVYERLRVPAERSDILRLELLDRFGGVYVDTDFECLRPLDPLIGPLDFFAAYYRHGRVNNAIVGAAPGHAVIVRALQEVRPRATWGTVDKHGTGPLFLDRLVKEAGVHVFERELFYPEWPERERAVAFHHMGRTWKDEAGVRRSIEIARERAEAARRELARIRREQRRAAAEGGLERAGAAAAIAAAEARHRAAGALGTTRRKADRAVGIASDALLPPLGRTLARLRASRGGGEVLVPRVLHTIRLGDDELDRDARLRLDAWRDLHPGWEWREWTEDALPEGLRPEIYERLRPPLERADLLAFELLLREGGVVVDPALSCRRPIDRLVGGHAAFAAARPDGAPSPLLVGSVPGHEAIAAALASARPIEWYARRDPGTGAAALAHALEQTRSLHLLPPSAFAPRDGLEQLRAHGSDAGGRLRPDRLDALRDELADAELRQRELEDELQRLRDGAVSR